MINQRTETNQVRKKQVENRSKTAYDPYLYSNVRQENAYRKTRNENGNEHTTN